MSLISPRRLIVLAGAGAAAYFLKRRGEAGGGQSTAGGASEQGPAGTATAGAAGAETTATAPVREPEPSEQEQATGTAGADALATPDVDPGDLTPAEGTDEVVIPDTSDDALVAEQTTAAEAEAAAVGGDVRELEANEPGFPSDPSTRPVEEGSGEAFETEEETDRELGAERELRGTPEPGTEP